MNDDELWTPVIKKQFSDELRELMDRYGLIYITGMTVENTDRRFHIDMGNVYFHTATERDKRDAREMALRMELDDALEQYDYERCEDIREQLAVLNHKFEAKQQGKCATCVTKLEDKAIRQCAYCGADMCERCYAVGDGYCRKCKDAGNTTIYWIK